MPATRPGLHAPCPACHGTGTGQTGKIFSCRHCAGSGYAVPAIPDPQGWALGGWERSRGVAGQVNYVPDPGTSLPGGHIGNKSAEGDLRFQTGSSEMDRALAEDDAKLQAMGAYDGRQPEHDMTAASDEAARNWQEEALRLRSEDAEHIAHLNDTIKRMEVHREDFQRRNSDLCERIVEQDALRDRLTEACQAATKSANHWKARARQADVDVSALLARRVELEEQLRQAEVGYVTEPARQHWVMYPMALAAVVMSVAVCVSVVRSALKL